MSELQSPNEIFAFLCRTSVKGKVRVIFHDIIPSVGSRIAVGNDMFLVKEIVHPLNFYGAEFRGDRAIQIFVEPTSGSLFSGAEDFEEMTPVELSKMSGLLS